MTGVDQSDGGFAHRGVVEGFYGCAWAHTDRLWLLERIGRWGMNRYLYAPKDDPLHRECWREPYLASTLAEFEELVSHGRAHGVEVGFALSPGLSIEYASADDRAALIGKLRVFADLGARVFCLTLDDVPSELAHQADRGAFRSLAAAHVALVLEVREALGPDAMLWVVPTDYAGTAPSDYLETLGRDLPADVEVGWTGRAVLSPSIHRAEAARRASALGRRLLVWDNFPVNDGPMRRLLHLGPLIGRDAALGEHVSGFLMNPMEQARASTIALHTAAAWLRSPATYEPEPAWLAAIEEAAPEAAEALALFARAHRFSALDPHDRDRELEALVERLKAHTEKQDDEHGGATVRADLLEALALRAAAGATLREQLADRRLLAEIEPWIDSHARECEAMTAAVEALEGLATAPSRMQQAIAFFRLEGRLTQLPVPSPISFGPRRAMYAQLEDLSDGGAVFGADPVLHLDRCLTDEVVRLAEQRALSQLSAPATATAAR